MKKETRLTFASDYMEGAHPLILRRLAETNAEKTAGYGLDEYSESAREKIRAACRTPEAAVFFLAGGTQTNAVMIDAFLRPWQGVIAAQSGHISVHEAGAIEFGSHKVLTLPHRAGKLTAEAIRKCMEAYLQDANHDHTVMPGMVYLSQPTEYGTLYSLKELEAISAVCRDADMRLYVDGARLAYALATTENDVSLPDLARLCDAFYIGGTKLGALCGEALVIPNPALDRDFRYIQKQHGARTAKGRLVGVQFAELLRDGLYAEIAHREDRLAAKLSAGLEALGYALLAPTQTNQVFPILPDADAAAIADRYTGGFWQREDETHSVVRFCISWATPEEAVDGLLEALREVRG